MDELKTWNKLSPEQQKAAKKALDRARLGLCFAVIKFLQLLFLANLLTIFLGRQIMQDVDDSTWMGFCFLSSVLNAIFLSRNLNSQLESNNAKLKADLLSITKE
jgi:hypothetical protein